MPDIAVALSRLGSDATFVDLDPANEQRVRELIKELEAIYNQEKRKLAS